MLVTADFVFVHIPKTAGTFIQVVLRDSVPVCADWAYAHTPYAELPERWRHLPVMCAIRNPWDWYVSWFHYSLQRGEPRGKRARSAYAAEKQAVWELLQSSGGDFKVAVTRACLGDFDHPLAAAMREQGIDFYTASVQEIVGPAIDRPDLHVLRFERLNRQLVRFLRAHDALTPKLRRAIRRRAPVRTSVHGPYADYYDDELAELVGRRASWLCSRFGYRFE